MFTPSRSHYYSAYDGDQVVFEGSDCCLEAEWTWYPGVDRPHMIRRYGDNASTYYYGRDELGSVTGLINVGGGRRQPLPLHPVGAKRLRERAKRCTTPSASQARVFDGSTGLYFMRARYYDPELARFISEDPIGIDGGDESVRVRGEQSGERAGTRWGSMRSVRLSPSRSTDPSGTHSWTEWKCVGHGCYGPGVVRIATVGGSFKVRRGWGASSPGVS